MNLYHGGVPGLHPGDVLIPSDPHVSDGCPICVARAEGRVYTVGEYRAYLEPYLARLGDRAQPVLDLIDGVADDMPIDPPSAKSAVYVTSNELYATWYAARSAGDLYRIKPLARLTHSTEDHFESFTVSRARVLQVIRRGVVLTDAERAEILAAWTVADLAKAEATA